VWWVQVETSSRRHPARHPKYFLPGDTSRTLNRRRLQSLQFVLPVTPSCHPNTWKPICVAPQRCNPATPQITLYSSSGTRPAAPSAACSLAARMALISISGEISVTPIMFENIMPRSDTLSESARTSTGKHPLKSMRGREREREHEELPFAMLVLRWF
jgi:hypothetical protein